MQKTIDALEIKESLEKLLNEVFYKDNQIVIERAGEAIAVVISPSEYEAYKKQRKKDMSIFDEIRKLNKGTDPEELGKDIQGNSSSKKQSLSSRGEAFADEEFLIIH